MPYDFALEIEAIEDYKADMLCMEADDYQAWIDSMERDYGDME